MLLCNGRVIPFPKPREAIDADAEQTQCSAEAQQAVQDCSSRTTLVIRKLGHNSSVEQFIELLNQAGFAAQYDFVYVPRHFTEGSSFGFAILNFIDDEFASEALGKIAAGTFSANGVTFTAEWSEAVHGLSAL